MRRSRSIEVESLEGRRLMTGLTAHLSTNHAVYQGGEAVVITLVETNTSKQSIQVAEGPSLNGFSVSENGRQVWRSNPGVQPQFLTLLTLQPGKSLTITASWDGQSNEATITNPYGPFVVKSSVPGANSVTIHFAKPAQVHPTRTK